MAELADAADSKSADLRVLGVQLPLPAPTSKSRAGRDSRILTLSEQQGLATSKYVQAAGMRALVAE